jgi:glycine/D-amino acid oxidase-like deaminating enzyme
MTGSYWQAGWRDRWAGLPLFRSADFAVIGGGFAGLMTAIELRARHPAAAIVLLEQERVGFGASGRNAGFLSPLPAPVWLLGAERSAEQAWGAARINHEMHAVARWIAAHVPDCELAPATLALQAQSRLSERALGEFIRRVALVGLAHRVIESRVWSGRTVLEMAAYTLHPYKLVLGLAAHAVQIGIQLHERTRVQRIEGLRAGGARVHTERGIVEARMVVACTNAYTSFDLGERIPALVVHGCMAASLPATGIVRDGDFTVEVNRAQTYHRMHEGRVIYGGVDTLRTPADEHALLQQLAASFPQTQITLTDAWSGQFHATTTGLPIIRTTENNHALVVNVGYGGTGVALTLACAKLAACVASNGTFTNVDDTRLLALIHATRISVRDSLRAVMRIALP